MVDAGARNSSQLIEQQTTAADTRVARVVVEREAKAGAETFEFADRGFGKFVAALESQVEADARQLCRAHRLPGKAGRGKDAECGVAGPGGEPARFARAGCLRV